MLAIETIAALEFFAIVWLLYSLVQVRRENHSLTERHRHLLSNEEKFSTLFAQDLFSLTITTIAGHHYLDVNAGYEKMTGYSRKEVVGRPVGEVSLWVNDDARSRFLEDLTRNGSLSHTEFQFRRKDGELRSAEAWAELVTIGDEPCILGLAVDVTERGRAQRAFQEHEGLLANATSDAQMAQVELGSRMIRAQEEERARLARELHDDINQRLALLANGIERLAPEIGDHEDSREREQLRALSRLTNEIVSDIQNLSHQLHPAKLRFLGLAAATRALCKEFSRQHADIALEYIATDLPRDLDEDISLNIFRTVQECLRNIAKHSNAHCVTVALSCTAPYVSVDVSDDGVGFDPERSVGKGLGLTSIQERLHHIGGLVKISSALGSRTHIHATVPIRLKPKMQNTKLQGAEDAHP